MESGLESLQDRLGYRFEAPALLTQALTHRSHGRNHNERLEFLGDSVLNCAVAAMLYARFRRYDEGALSRLRSNLVKQQSLYEIAQALSLSEVLVLGEGERRSGGLKRPSILADTVEAIVGAVFLDSGFNAAQAVIGRLYEPILRSVDPKTLGKDAKTLLQEYLQGKRIPLPVYEVVATHGAAHSQVFEVECSIPKLGVQVSGSGGSRRAVGGPSRRGGAGAAATGGGRLPGPEAALPPPRHLAHDLQPPAGRRRGDRRDAEIDRAQAVPRTARCRGAVGVPGRLYGAHRRSLSAGGRRHRAVALPAPVHRRREVTPWPMIS